MKIFFGKTLVLILTIFLGSSVLQLHAQQKTFNYGLELRGTAGTDDFIPFWLYSNQHGIIDPHSPGSNAIFNFQKNLMNDRSGFDYGFGATLAGRYSENETIFFNQLYGTLSYGAFQLKAGRFYEQLGTVDSMLSMGSLAISPNATPMPKIKIGIPEYTDVPLTHGFVEVKAEIAHGWFERNRKIKSPWLHQKSAYIRMGGDFVLRPYAGLVDEATWAGTDRQFGRDLPDSFNDFWRVLTAKSGGGENLNDGENVYKLGDHRGIWDFGFYLSLAGINFTGYRQYIYNDKDGLKLQNPDALTGLSVRLPARKQHIVTGLLYEYLYTKKQSGPIPPGNRRDEAGGRDNYYNNYLYRTGWTYEGRTIGNPLFLNAYNSQLGVVANYQLDSEDRYGIANNRIVAHHFGVIGRLSKTVDYKLLATWSKNYGNYYDGDLYDQKDEKTDFYSRPEQWSFLAKFTYQPFPSLKLNTSLAGDFGELYNNRVGIMFGIKLLGTSAF